ncbi:hypothetical protein [Amycolatopsis sp. NPDC051903]|uniref:hypothetical protein n=1 Tax=Amycolatopsis sp. NPDC051903 TaxID=3363936 RepID=UPI0037A2F14F
MSHSLALSDEQRAHLSIAEADTARLNQLLRTVDAVVVTGHEWQVAAGLASAAAVHVQRVAALAEPGAGRTWATTARLLRDSAARFELWSGLADVAAELAEVGDHAAHEAA